MHITPIKILVNSIASLTWRVPKPMLETRTIRGRRRRGTVSTTMMMTRMRVYDVNDHETIWRTRRMRKREWRIRKRRRRRKKRMKRECEHVPWLHSVGVCLG